MMHRRQFMKAAVLTGVLQPLSSPLLAKPPKVVKRPNILFIFSDDHSDATIGAYGSKYGVTPNIDRLAKDGAVFLNSFCCNSICQPSRASILTGKHSHLNGVTYNGARWNGKQTVFPRLLKTAGYQTALIGKWHLTPDPSDEFEFWKVLSGFGGQGAFYNPGFNTQTGPQQLTGYSTDLITDEAIRWLDTRRDETKPFLLMTQFKSPHVPRQPPVRYLNLFDGKTLPEPKTLHDDYKGRQSYASKAWMEIAGLGPDGLNIHPPRGSKQPWTAHAKKVWDNMTPAQQEGWHKARDPLNADYYKRKAAGEFKDRKARVKYNYQRFIKDYLACVKAVDDNVGRLLDWIEKNKLGEDTIVVYSSDQSYFIGEHGWAEKRWMYEPGLRMPFVIRWPGHFKSAQKPTAMIQNIDYAPTFLDAAGVKPPAQMQGRSLVPILTSGKKPKDWRDMIYYHYYHHGAHNVPRHDGVRTGRYKLIHFYTDDKYELYDLKTDPQELKSIYDDSAYEAVRKEMLLRLAQQREANAIPADTFSAPYAFPPARRQRRIKRNDH